LPVTGPQRSQRARPAQAGHSRQWARDAGRAAPPAARYHQV